MDILKINIRQGRMGRFLELDENSETRSTKTKQAPSQTSHFYSMHFSKDYTQRVLREGQLFSRAKKAQSHRLKLGFLILYKWYLCKRYCALSSS